MNRIEYGEKDSNGAVCNKDNCFEIIQHGHNKGDTIHVDSKSDYNTWMSCIERQINPGRFQSKAAYNSGNIPQAASGTGGNRSGVGFGNAGLLQSSPALNGSYTNTDMRIMSLSIVYDYFSSKIKMSFIYFLLAFI